MHRRRRVRQHIVAAVAASQRIGVDDVELPADEVVRAWIEPNPRSAPPMPGMALTAAQQALQAAVADRSLLDDDATPASERARSMHARAG